jgi:flagellar biosynthetic protein FliP
MKQFWTLGRLGIALLAAASIGPTIAPGLTRAIAQQPPQPPTFTVSVNVVDVDVTVRDASGVVAELAAAAPGNHSAPVPGEATPLSLLVPAFLLSELQRGFEVGFVIFLPFLVIDLVVASILMSMGMMMVPPVVVSLPLKLAFFVVADGWTLLAGALIRGYG